MVAALAAALARKGHDVRVVLPLYRQIKDSSSRVAYGPAVHVRIHGDRRGVVRRSLYRDR